MIYHLVRFLQSVAILGCGSSAIYYLISLWSGTAFLRKHKEAGRNENSVHIKPAVSILKPLKGVDPEIYESFRSHCLQDYPQYEIVFGVSDANDPAIASVRQLQAEFPDKAIRLIVCPERLGANVKVSNLEQMLAVAQYEHLIVNDSDIRVQPDYLRKVMAPLADDRVGMVTCLYRGKAEATLGSKLEALGISTDFCASVLVAQTVERGIRYGLGSTMAFRRNDLEKIGGFRAIVDFLADDYELGHRIATLGLNIVLSDVVVETHLPPYDFAGYLSHQMRWARGVRDARLGGYIGLISTFGLFWAVVNVVLARASGWAWMLLAILLALRLVQAIVIGRGVLQDGQTLRDLWLLPLRDLAAVAVWAASFIGHTVVWRGERFTLKNGKLTPAS